MKRYECLKLAAEELADRWRRSHPKVTEHIEEHMEDIEAWRERKLGLRKRQRRDEPRRR
jgi:hypothetical protein